MPSKTLSMTFHRMAQVAMAALWLSSSAGLAADFLKWTDENGTVHFADSFDKVPEKYQDRVENKKLRETKPVEKSVPPVERSGSEKGTADAPKEPSEPVRHEVPYEAYEGMARRVIVSVTFNNSVTARMALDTGAPGMVISPPLAERLGVFGKDEGKLWVTAGGIGGRIPAMRIIIDAVRIGGAKDRFIPATVVPSISGAFEGLIGMDFMSNYLMRVDPSERRLIFEEIPPRSDAPGGHDESWWRGIYKEFGSSRAAWKGYVESLDREIRNGSGSDIANLKKLREFAGRQYGEADKLLSRIDRYANEHTVPRHWRKE